MSQFLPFTKSLASEAGGLIKKYFHKGVSINWKSKNDPVTEADKKSEELIIKRIRKTFPKHSILGEESGQSSGEKSKYRWIIDPVDGTKNFAHGIPIFAVSIALEIDGENRVGVIYNPIADEMFYTEKGKGVFLNGKRIHVSKKTQLEKAVISTGFVPDRSSTDFKKGLKTFNVLTVKTSAVRRLGSAAMDLAYVACGRLDAFWEYGLHLWDVAAGEIIITEAGGRVTDTSSSPLAADKNNQVNILATNTKIHSKMLNNLA